MCRNRILLLVLLSLSLLLGLKCGSDSPTGTGDPHIGLAPDSTVVALSASQRFDVSSSYGVQDLIWFVNSVQGGTSITGVIDTSGLYIAPASVPEDSVVSITVMAVGNSAINARSTVVIRGGSGAPRVVVLPADTTLSPGEPIVFGKEVEGCASEEVTWTAEALLSGDVDVGSIGADGSYVMPGTLDQGLRLLVRAASQSCADKTGIATVTVVPPAEFTVELEDYTGSHDEVDGSMLIRSEGCGRASGGAMVKGLDYPGEWLDVPFTVDEPGTYEVTLRYAALAGYTIRATASFAGCALTITDPEVDFVMDEGEGLG